MFGLADRDTFSIIENLIANIAIDFLEYDL